MKLNRDINTGTHVIRSYEPGRIIVNEQTYTQSLIISSDQLIENWAPTHINELCVEHWTEVLALEPELVIVGTGSQQQFPPHALFQPLIEKQIGFEIMDTAAACRTFTVLMAEDRNAVAALIL